MRLRLLVPLGALGVAPLALAACSSARSAEVSERADDAVAVRVQAAAREARPTGTTASGVVEARTASDVGFQIPGKVARVGPDEGEFVRAGTVLAELDPTDYRFALDQAEAQATQAGHERDRLRTLAASGSVAPNDLDRAENGARQSGAAAGLARKRLADTRLVAPISGVVARRAIDPGETAAPGTPVFTVMDVATVRVRVGVPEADVGAMRVGQPATVHVPALPGESFAGRVSLVGIAADPTTRSYAVEIEVPNGTRRLRPGMVAEATVERATRDSVVAVPAAAVVRGADGATAVYVLDAPTKRAHVRRVAVGGAWNDVVEIARGVMPGEMVLVAGQQRVRDGARVTLTAETAP
jgi:membrane fusion protein (multidrug efflux system)